MHFDFMTILGIGLVIFVALVLYRRSRENAADGSPDERAVGQRRDVVEAVKSMRKD